MSGFRRVALWGAMLAVAVSAPALAAEPAPPPDPAPVYLVRPVEGTVDVTNWPPVQEVRVVGGAAGEPLEIKGEVGLRLFGPLPVEVVGQVKPEGEGAGSPVQIDDTHPVRVWVENPAAPPPVPPEPQFTAYTFQGKLSGVEERLRRIFVPAAGGVFHLTDLQADSRPDAPLKIRVIASAKSVAGTLAGAGSGEVALAVLDLRKTSSLRLGTPIPLTGEFALEAEAIAAGQAGTTFSLVALGYVLPK